MQGKGRLSPMDRVTNLSIKEWAVHVHIQYIPTMASGSNHMVQGISNLVLNGTGPLKLLHLYGNLAIVVTKN